MQHTYLLTPRLVIIMGYFIGQQLFRKYANRCSRHNFTHAQLFGYLVLREFFRLSYRAPNNSWATVPNGLPLCNRAIETAKPI